MGKIVVITGAGSGLGRTVARHLAEGGDTVVLLGRTLSKLEAAAAEIGDAATAIQCDIGAPDSVRSAFARIAELFPAIDVLINNAAIYEPFPIDTATDAQIEAAMTANFAGPIYCSRAAIPLMAKGGLVINVSSETVTLNFALFSLYQSSKAGMERFSEALREEVRPSGLRVTTLRAGQMYDETMSLTMDPGLRERFVVDNIKRGIDLRSRPISHFKSVAPLFRMLLDLPADLHIPLLVAEAHKVPE
jgi:meso-butanediol dehydrogenase/(S,S)-butanediol dehydrogenase/diacetyl reductase